jgi:SAM-dependent methyltransferase
MLDLVQIIVPNRVDWAHVKMKLIMNQELQDFIDKYKFTQNKVLDLGCGDGRDIKKFQELGWFTEGVDILMGVNLNNIYRSPNKPFDLVISNYVIHKLNKPENLVQTILHNLGQGGYFFLQTFDVSDEWTRRGYSEEELRMLFDGDKWEDIKTRRFKVYDNENGHEHWHVIFEITGKKRYIPTTPKLSQRSKKI